MYKHKLVEGLAQLIEKYTGGGKDPMMRAIWFGIKGQVPHLLKTLDENDKMVDELRMTLLGALDVQPGSPKEQQVAEVTKAVQPVAEEEPGGD